MKEELGGNNIIEFVGRKPKTYNVFLLNRWLYVKKKLKKKKKCVIKRKLKFEDYK